MKRNRIISLILSLALLCGMLPLNALAGEQDFEMRIAVTKDESVNGREVLKVAVQIKTPAQKSIVATRAQVPQSASLAYDAALFDLLDTSNAVVTLAAAPSFSGTYTKRPLGYHADAESSWQNGGSKHCAGTDGNTLYSHLEPWAFKTTLSTNGSFETVIYIRLALKAGKSLADVGSSAIRLAEVAELAANTQFSQSVVASVHDGTDQYTYPQTQGASALAKPEVIYDFLLKYTGTQAQKPTYVKQGDAVTLTEQTIENETVEYAVAQSSDVPASGFQTERTFTNLAVGNYYFFARVKANAQHAAGVAAVSDMVTVAPGMAFSYPSISALTYGQAIAPITPVIEGGLAAKTYTLSQGTLPAGLTLGTATGIISGTPSSGGEAAKDATITVSDGEVQKQTVLHFPVVAKAENQVSVSIGSVSYGQSPAPSATTQGGATVTYAYADAASGVYGPWSSQNSVGTYWVKADAAETENYKAAVSEPKSFQVTAAANSGSVSISGDAKYKETLSAQSAGVHGELAYQWKRGEAVIAGATSQSYVITADDIGRTLCVEVRDARCNYSGTITSAPTQAVAKADALSLTEKTTYIYHKDKTAGTIEAASLAGLPADIKNPVFCALTASEPNGVLTAQLVNGKIAYTPTGTAGANKVATLQVSVQSDNYADSTAVIKVHTTDLSIPWPEAGSGITIKSDPTYGDRSSALLYGFAADEVTATSQSQNIKGHFSLQDANEFLPAGSGKVTLVFTPTPGQIISDTFTKDYPVAVAKKAVTATVKNQTRSYGAPNPALTFTLADGALVGDDTQAALAVSLQCAAAADTACGPVAITGTAGESANYSVTIAPGTLTITLADYGYLVGSVQSVKAGAGLQAISVPAVGTGVNGETPPVTCAWYKDAGRTQLALDSDLGGIAAGRQLVLYWKASTNDTNYVATPKAGELTIRILEADPQQLAFANGESIVKTYADDSTFSNTAANSSENGGSVTYQSNNIVVATVDQAGEVTIHSAGTAVITATAAAVPGTFAETSIGYTLTVNPKQVGLEWTQDANMEYTGTAKTVAATATGTKQGDEIAVVLTGESATNAGSYEAKAVRLTGEKSANYVLPSEVNYSYTVTRAIRILDSLADQTLLGDSAKSKILPASSTNIDNSFAPVYQSSNAAAVQVNGQGEVKAFGNGTAVITVTAPQTQNYLSASTQCTVTAIAKPVTGVSVTGEAGDMLAASIEGSTVTVTGFVTEGADLVITPQGAQGLVDPITPVTISVVDNEKLANGAVFTVTAAGTDPAMTVSYQIDTHGITFLPKNVVVEEEKKATEIGGGIAEGVKGAVQAALSDIATKTEGLLASSAQIITDAVESLQDTGNLTAVVTMNITAKKSTQNSFMVSLSPVLRLLNHEQAEVAVIPIETLPAPAAISIKLPSYFEIPQGVSKLFAKHTKKNNSFEYLPITITGSLGNYIASWDQKTFSDVEITTDTRKATVTYHFEDGSEDIRVYTAKDVGTAVLPTDSRDKSNFLGWEIAGVKRTGTLTDEMLTQIQGVHSVSGSFESTGTPLFPGGNTGGVAPSVTITITATAGAGGSINPQGEVKVAPGEDARFVITPDKGYEIASLLVDGKQVKAAQIYTFEKVSEAHAIAVTFQKSKLDVLEPFTDIKGHWSEDAVRFMVEKGIMNGVSATEIRPNGETDRATVITMLYRMAGSPETDGMDNFSDVAPGLWYSKATAWAREQGVSNGMGSGFAPNLLITRESLATLLWRMAGSPSMEGYTGLDSYSDQASISFWARTAMAWAHEQKLLTGRTETTLALQETASRGEVAAVMQRIIEGK